MLDFSHNTGTFRISPQRWSKICQSVNHQNESFLFPRVIFKGSQVNAPRLHDRAHLLENRKLKLVADRSHIDCLTFRHLFPELFIQPVGPVTCLHFKGLTAARSPHEQTVTVHGKRAHHIYGRGNRQERERFLMQLRTSELPTLSVGKSNSATRPVLSSRVPSFC